MKKWFLLCLLLVGFAADIQAQRKVDNLGRGLVAVKLADNGNTIGTLVSWRRLGTEYYDVTYNLYYNGALLASGLTNTNYSHGHSISGNETYQLAAVVNGVEQEKCSVTKVWPGWQMYKISNGNRYVGGYLDITLAPVYDRNGNDVTSHYEPNDAEFADLDGDGELEMIIKRLNTVDANAVYPQSNITEFVMLDAYDINWREGGATLMWRIDCGPNMVSLNSTEIDIIAFDWDEDGRAEVVLRGADNMIVYGSTGQNQLYTIGDMNVNTRNTFDPSNGAQYAWTHTGAEYLLYINGQTGALFQQMDYPLTRESASAWGDNYGHRSSKYFFGAPFLDGRKASLFLGRGIYTRHKMMALDLNRSSHQWSERWSWNCNDSGSPWYGNGYHNYVIADVDEDGRDEIVYGSMVIDDNGKGLHTTGFGHGDAQHVSDFNPWRKGLEFFGCLEEHPYWGNNYRDATTGEVLFKHTQPVTYTNGKMDDNDDGRALMANFSNNYPGSIGRSAGGAEISSVKNQLISGLTETLQGGGLNFRIYWDGDLLSECQDAAGTENGYITLFKPGIGRILNAANTKKDENGNTIYYNTAISNNSTKHNTCFQGDIIGDWREEFVARVDANTVRIYSTGSYSDYSIPTLWHDHQYRQAMVWQMMAYNQPPHLSYFLGEMEGITVAPPPLITNGRTVIEDGTNINSAYNGLHLLHNQYANTTLAVEDGTPGILTINVPAWVKGNNNNNNITTTTYTCTLTGGGFSGDMRLVKQGNGILNMASANHTYTGDTKVWGGTLNFNGMMQNSHVWMNRHTTLASDGGKFKNGVELLYGAQLSVTNTVEVNELTMDFGSRLVLNMNNNARLNAGKLILQSKVGESVWENYGPEYLSPVIQITLSERLEPGRYVLAHYNELEGSLNNVIFETVGINEKYAVLGYDDNEIYVDISAYDDVKEPTIAITDMAEYTKRTDLYPSTGDYKYYLPVVSVGTEDTDGQTPKLSGSFTNLLGEKAEFRSTGAQVLYSENFEGSQNTSDYWKNNNDGSSIFSPNYTGSEGQCVAIKSSSDKGDYVPINVDYSGLNKYTMEFDAYFNDAPKTTDFAVMSEDHFPSWVYNWGYTWQTTTNNTHNPYLFFLRRGEGSTTFSLNEGATTVTLSNSTWYHFTLTVNIEKGTVDYNITKKGNTSSVKNGTYTLPNGESAECDGIYIRNGRYNTEPGGAGIDNIVIKTEGTDLSSYTFTEPGTLEITASLGEDSGYEPSTTTFEVLNPYWMPYGKKFNEITGENIAAELGNNWDTVPISGRWANWNKSNSIYGENYQMHEVINNSTPIYLGDEEMLYTERNSIYKPSLVEGFGVGRNSDGAGAAFHVINMLNDKAFIDYTIDVSRGANVSGDGKYEKHFVQATEQGTYDFTLSSNYTLAELYIYLPVSLNDELCSAVLPQVIENGSAHVYRSSLSGDSWASMVVPFDMTASQVKETFGEDVVIGNLNPYFNEPDKVYFETETGSVKANVPFLIKGVTKTPPYLIMGITSSPVEIPMLSTSNFDYIGTFLNKGLTPFTTSDYFFMANSDKLKQVASDGMKMTVKGYRAWFHSNTGAQHSISVSFSDHQFPDEEPLAEDFGNQDVTSVLSLEDASRLSGDWYNLLGQKMTSHPMRRGVYIVNGRRVIIK